MENSQQTAKVNMQHPCGAVVEFALCAPKSTDLVKGVDKFLSLLVDQGWSAPVTVPINEDGGSAPLCPIHKKPMKPSQHGGWYCPIKIAEDDGTGKPAYCKATVK